MEAPPADRRRNDDYNGKRCGDPNPCSEPPSSQRWLGVSGDWRRCYLRRALRGTNNGNVAALRQFDDQRIVFASVQVILTEPCTKPDCFGSHDRILLGVVTRRPSENFDGHQRLLEFTVFALEMALDDKAQKLREARVARKPWARQDPFQLPQRGLTLCLFSQHRYGEYRLFSYPTQGYYTLFPCSARSAGYWGGLAVGYPSSYPHLLFFISTERIVAPCESFK